jgi:glyoxylase-like metal-dependent hydrolase (beta-lactamase superfamily II)
VRPAPPAPRAGACARAPALDAFRHKLDTEFSYAPRPDALAYADGAAWDLGGGVRVRAVHLPGHTAGHCALVVEPAGIAFIGDIDLSTFGPYYGDATSNLGDFRRSLARLPELDAAVWITSHHKGVYTERAAFEEALRAYTARLDEREAGLIERLRAAPASLDDLAAGGFLYPPGFPGPSAQAIEKRSISQHLDELIAAGRVIAQDDRYRLRA